MIGSGSATAKSWSARLATDDRYGLVGLPDWDTLVHLDDDDVRDTETVRSELEHLRQRSRLSHDENRRLLQLLTASELLVPQVEASTLPLGSLSSLRAATLEQLGKSELALIEIEEAPPGLDRSGR